MPKFMAPLTQDDPNFDEAYALAFEAPLLDPEPGMSPVWLDAFVIPDLVGCSISQSLAEDFDPTLKEGDVLFITLIQEHIDPPSTHRYLLGIPVHFTGGKRKLLRISVQHLLGMFDVERVIPQNHESAGAMRLELTLRKCVRSGADGLSDPLSALA
jgi:hypothetical protein